MRNHILWKGYRTLSANRKAPPSCKNNDAVHFRKVPDTGNNKSEQPVMAISGDDRDGGRQINSVNPINNPAISAR